MNERIQRYLKEEVATLADRLLALTAIPVHGA